MPALIIDLNADIGEHATDEGAAAEHEILSYVSSASIACGAHAGSLAIMNARVGAALAKGVRIGAHPSYPDRANFGRRSFKLGEDITAAQLSQSLTEQMSALLSITQKNGAKLAFVKPHGALYNDASASRVLSELICDCVKTLSPELCVIGAANSHFEAAAISSGLRFIPEGFIDRAYGANGQIMPRSVAGALITDPQARIRQALSLAFERQAQGPLGPISVKAQTLCLHGDSAGAAQSAKAVRAALEQNGARIQSFI